MKSAILFAASAAAVQLGTSDPDKLVIDPALKTEITEKYEGFDKFLAVVYSAGCGFQHKNDIRNEVDRLVEEEGKDYDEAMKNVQAQNAAGMERACETAAEEALLTQKRSCAQRWGTKQKEANECHALAEKQTQQFKTRCQSNVPKLKAVFKTELTRMDAQRECYNGHCKEFPEVYNLVDADGNPDAAAQKAKVEERCDQRMCTGGAIEANCGKEWDDAAAVHNTELAAQCADKDSTLPDAPGTTEQLLGCTMQELNDATTSRGTCKDGTVTKCDGDKGACENKAANDSQKAACQDRHDFCIKKGHETCTKIYKKAADAAKTKCKKVSKAALENCLTKSLEKGRAAHMTQCEADTKPQCVETCKAKCNVDKMNECLTKVKGNGATEQFCDFMADMIRETSSVYIANGNPKPIEL